MFGEWVHRRRKTLDLTQEDLARKVSCSLSMLRKIERDERRPSEQLAELLADFLAVDDSQRETFLQLARGKFSAELNDPGRVNGSRIPLIANHSTQSDEYAPFVTRERELALLSEHLDRAMQARGRIVFISGEAGRGKTSLLVEFARRSLINHSDLIVAGGRCDVFAGQGDPLLPFRDIFRLLAGDLENSGMHAILNHTLVVRLAGAIPVITDTFLDIGPGLIDKLIPGGVLEANLAHSYPHHIQNTELLLRLKQQRARHTLSETIEQRQDSLFDEIATTLKVLAQRQPLMLILDDLHWIDHSSAALLGHLAMRIKQSRILIVGSYRPEDLVQGTPIDELRGRIQNPLQEVLGESLRQFGDNRIDLDRSEPGEELEFVNAVLDVSDNKYGKTFRQHLARLTEGQPLFVIELLRDMKERGDIIQTDDGTWQENESMGWEDFPARVEGVIEKRITRLPSDLRDILTVASVQGEIFYAEVIARVKQTDPQGLTRRLSAELDRQHRLIRGQGVKHAGIERLSQYQFRHHLFQKYLYGRLAAAERMYLHEAVGNALEASYLDSPTTDDVPSVQLARHFQEASLSEKASRYLLMAGRQAARILAFEEATVHFESGLDELQHLANTPDIVQLKYTLRLALAQALWHGGHVKEAFVAYREFMDHARTLNDPQALARAVLAYEEPRWRLNMNSDHSQQIIREALKALGEEQSGLQVRLLVSLSRSLLASGDQHELRTTVDQTLRMARRIVDPLALCDALRIKAQIDRRPETTTARLAAIQEMIAIAESIADQERLADGLDLYVYDLLELGHIDLVDQMIAAQSKAASEIRQPFQMHVAKVFQTMRAIMVGKFEDAERLAYEAADISRQLGLADMDGIFGIHMFTIRREQGRINEIAPLVKLVVANSPGDSAWRPGLALMYCILDEREACQTIFEDLASDGFAFVPQDLLWVATLAYLSEVCIYVGNLEKAAELYKLLQPYNGRTVVIGGATACYGAVARYLGMLATAQLNWDLAERHFQEAMDLDANMAAWPWLVHSQYEYASMLLMRGRKKDRQQANAILVETARAAQKMGMAYLARKVEKLANKNRV